MKQFNPNRHYLVITKAAAEWLRHLDPFLGGGLGDIKRVMVGALGKAEPFCWDDEGAEYDLTLRAGEGTSRVRARVNITDQPAPDGRMRVAFLCRVWNAP